MTKDTRKEIKNWKLRQIRKAHGVTQEDLADALNISRGAYQHLETKGVLTDDLLMKLSRFFDLSMEDFISKDVKEEPPHVFRAPEPKKVSHRILSEDEKRLLLGYDALTEENKNKIIKYLEGILAAQPEDK